jgi:hypothetical protein
MSCIFHVYVNLHWASEAVVGVAGWDPAAIVLATEVRTQVHEGRMVIRGTKVARRVCACGLIVPSDLAVATKRDLIPDPIVVWGRKGIRKLPILIR